MNQQAQDLLMGAPAPVEAERLKELHLKLSLPKVKQQEAGKAEGLTGKQQEAGKAARPGVSPENKTGGETANPESGESDGEGGA